MPEWLDAALAWLDTTLGQVGNVSWGVLTARLCAAFLLGCVAAAIYGLTTRGAGRSSMRPLVATLVLLSVLMALVTQVTGDNLARAFGLVGALSIVRFRTVVEDTRDTAFVIFAVVVGMSAGAGQALAALMGAPLVFLGAWLFRPRAAAVPDVREATLGLRLGATRPPDERIAELLERHAASYRLVGLATARGGAALDVTYAVELLAADRALALVADLSRVEGVQGVELKERRPEG